MRAGVEGASVKNRDRPVGQRFPMSNETIRWLWADHRPVPMASDKCASEDTGVFVAGMEGMRYEAQNNTETR